MCQKMVCFGFWGGIQYFWETILLMVVALY